MNDCNSDVGHGTCNTVTGSCECSSVFWKGGDCSLFSSELKNSSLLSLNDTIGPVWLSYHWPPLPAGEPLEGHMTISSELPVDVYVGLGASSDPNTYNFDMVFKNVTDMHLDSSKLPQIAGEADRKSVV